MKHQISSFESLDYENLAAVGADDYQEINSCLIADIPVYYDDKNFRVYNEAGTWIADLEVRQYI